jgi:NADH:ubiquinone oxidoreductase subunit E
MTLEDQVGALVAEHGQNRTSLIPILQGLLVNSHESYLSKGVLQEVARQMDLSAAEVYGTASFYAFLEIERRGQNIIRVCKTISCDMHKKQEIVRAIEERLNIRLGETTADNKFTFLETNCVGQCHKGPAMLINDEIYTELTPAKVVEILNKYL